MEIDTPAIKLALEINELLRLKLRKLETFKYSEIRDFRKTFSIILREQFRVGENEFGSFVEGLELPENQIGPFIDKVETRLDIEIEKFLRTKELPVQQATNDGTREYLLDRCKKECERRNLPKLQTINKETKHEIAEAIGMKPPIFKNFKAGEPSYQLISKMLSELKYSRKRPLSI